MEITKKQVNENYGREKEKNEKNFYTITMTDGGVIFDPMSFT